VETWKARPDFIICCKLKVASRVEGEQALLLGVGEGLGRGGRGRNVMYE